MNKEGNKSYPVFLYGLTFAAPIVYLITLQEMDSLQKLIFSVLAIIVFLSTISTVKRSKKIPLNTFLLLVIIILPLSFITAFINSSSFFLPLLVTNLLAPFCIILLTAIMIHLFREEKFLKIISTAIVITSGLFGIIGLLEVFEIKVIPLPTIIPPGSTLGHRSFAAEYLLPALPFFLIAKELIKKDYYPLLIISAFINLSFILFTRSRSAILALGIIASLYFIYFFIQRKKEIKKLLPIAAVVLLAFIFSLLPAKGGERTDLKETAESLLDTKFKSNRLRITFWDASLKMISENFFTGVGLYKWSGTYPKYYGKEFNDQNVIKVHSIHAHSDFLELFAENGFFAPLFYLLLLLTILIILYSRSKNNQLYFYIFISVLATGIFSLVAFPFYKFSSHFLLSVGTGIALHSKNVNSSKAINVSLKKLMWFLGILLLITSITSILKMKSEFDFIRSVQYLRVKDYSMMNQELEKISNVLFPFDASKQPVDYYRGIANYYLGNNDVAMKSNLDAEKVAPYNPIVLQNIAGSYQSLGNYKKSVEMFERVKKLFPHYINPQINLIHAYLQIGEFEKSRKLFESIKKKEPNHPRLQEFRDKFHPE